MSKKGDARIARQHDKYLKAREKAARLAAEPQSHTVRSEYAKTAPKDIRAGADPNACYRLRVTWKVEGADREGAWSWGVPRDWNDSAWDQIIKPKLDAISQMT